MNVKNIWKFALRRGNSHDPRNGACLLDAVSWLEYGTLGDHPPCVCPVIAAFGRGINDAMSDAGRQRLRVFIPRLVGTVDPGAERERAEYLAWQAIRVFAPLALDAAGLSAEAEKLRSFDGDLKATVYTAYAAAICAGYAGGHAAAGRYCDAAYWACDAAAGAAGAADRTVVEDAMIAALDGVLKIGRQAEPIIPTRLVEAARSFDLARSS